MVLCSVCVLLLLIAYFAFSCSFLPTIHLFIIILFHFINVDAIFANRNVLYIFVNMIFLLEILLFIYALLSCLIKFSRTKKKKHTIRIFSMFHCLCFVCFVLFACWFVAIVVLLNGNKKS